MILMISLSFFVSFLVIHVYICLFLYVRIQCEMVLYGTWTPKYSEMLKQIICRLLGSTQGEEGRGRGGGVYSRG